ncbi:putative ankyrin repeat-containing protein [Sclerotinia borealis F-4128]|uniref:Putative ankyrin repeat-containing protein n=1 Tax=Sclerotinia borealis (strain F-4128) TaxID=1432307 RepID=W9CDC7_SCLBF|nr:putative ankyrin repeat-containing protein [Sclerotinia borealis F-4128]
MYKILFGHRQGVSSMETNGGSRLPQNSGISLMNVRSVENPSSARSSIGDDQVESQNSAPRISVEVSRDGRANINGGPKSEIDELPFKRNPYFKSSSKITEVDIIGVPAIGGDPEKTWCPDAKFTQDDVSSPRESELKSAFKSMTSVSPAYSRSPSKQPTMRPLKRMEPAWILRDIRSHEDMDMVRVLLYDHGYPKDGDTLKQLANRLLDNVKKLRSIEKESRPLFFICHSTGGLVVKIALTEARRLKDSILNDCYGVTFFATPHRGSSYLSQSGFSRIIRETMGLSRELPTSITKQLELDHHSLKQIGKDFKALATDLKVWTFFETLDSDLTGLDQGKPFHAPIASIKSTILNLRNETVYPLVSTHTKCATFGLVNSHTKDSYLLALAASVKNACKLSKETHYELNLENKVMVEINGFYEGNTTTPMMEPPIRVWSTNKTIQDFKRYGPTKLLKERREEVSVVPVIRQFLSHNTRAPYLPLNKVTSGHKVKDDSLNHKPTSRGSSPDLLSRRAANVKAQPLGGLIGEKTTGAVPSIPALGSQIETDDTAAKPEPLLRHSESQTAHNSFLSPSGADFHRNKSSLSQGLKESESLVTPVLAPLQNSNVSKLKLTWIHVPFNNPTWVLVSLQALNALLPTNQKGYSPKNINRERTRCSQQNVRYRALAFETLSPLASPKIGVGSIDMNHIQMCLYLPYLHFDTYKVLVKRRALVKQRIKQGRSRPVPQHVAKLDTQESQVLWQYLGHDPPINARRTLDQFGYPSLLDTRARDDDQMLYKMTKERHIESDVDKNHSVHGISNAARKSRVTHEKEEDDEEEVDGYSGNFDSPSERDMTSDDDVLDGNILMVDQLWLWVINGSVVTFFPRRSGLKADGRLYQQADLRNSIFNEVNADLTHRCENAHDLAALVALHAVTLLFERTSHPDLDVFRTFEEAINDQTEKMTASFKSFRARGLRDKAVDIDDLRTTSIRAKHKREDQIVEKQNRDTTHALLELRDIADELNTLKTLFASQMTEIKIMLDVYEKRELTTNGLAFLSSAEVYLGEYTQRIERMIESVKSFRDDFDKLLGMIQRQTQVDEVRLSRHQADLASSQSRSVMIFTVFTVIFLPLSFFTGLFGMNVKEWGGGDYLSIRTVGVIAIPTSFSLITLALIIAWSTRIRLLLNSIGSAFTNLYRLIHKHINKTIHNIFSAKNTGGKRSEIRRTRQRRKRSRLEKQRTRLQYEEWDFWESHKERREKGYKMPSRNRRNMFGVGSGVGESDDEW